MTHTCESCFRNDGIYVVEFVDFLTGKLEKFSLCEICREEFIVTRKFSISVSLPKGVTETNFADSVGVMTEKKRKDGTPIKMKNGGSVFSIPLNITKLKAMIEKYTLERKDGRTGDSIVWLTAFERVQEKEKQPESKQ